MEKTVPEEMQQAIPAHDYSADERARRARGAGIALLFLAAVALAVPTALMLVFWLW